LPSQQAFPLKLWAEHVASTLLMRRQKSGLWKDFNLSIGASDSWVTAYVLHALGEYAQGLEAKMWAPWKQRIQPSLNALNTCSKLGGGYAYNAGCQIDADSTAWALRAFCVWGYVTPENTRKALWRHLDRETGEVRTYIRKNPKDRWGWAHQDVAASLALAALDDDGLNTSTIEHICKTATAKWLKRDGTMNGFWWAHAAFPTSLLYNLHDRLGHPLSSPQNTGAKLNNVFDSASAIITLLSSYEFDEGRLKDLTKGMLGGLSICEGQAICPPDARLQAPAPFLKGLDKDAHCRDLHGIFTLATVLKALTKLVEQGWSEMKAVSSPDKNISFKSLADVIAKGRSPTLEDITSEYCSLSAGYPLEYSFRLNSEPGQSERFTTRLGIMTLAEPYRYRSILAHLESVLMSQRAKSIIPHLRDLETTAACLEDPRFTLWFGREKQADTMHSIEKIYVNAALFGPVEERVETVITWLEKCIPSFNGNAISSLLKRIGVKSHLQEIGLGFVGPKIRIKLYWEFESSHRDHLANVAKAFNCSNPLEADEVFVFSHTVQGAEIPVLRSGIAFILSEQGELMEGLTLALSLPKRIKTCEATSQTDLRFGSNKLDAHNLRPTLLTRTVSKKGISNTLYARPQ